PAFVFAVSRLLAERGRHADADRIIQLLQQQAPSSYPLSQASDEDRMRGRGHDFLRDAATIALRAGNAERGLALARQATPPNARDYRDHLWLGEMLEATGRPHEAEAALRRAVELGPHAREAWIALVAFLGSSGQIEQADTVVSEAQRALAPEQWALAQA